MEDETLPFTPPVPVDNSNTPKDQLHSGQVNIQVMAGSPSIKKGHVALVLHNVPISPVQMPDGSQALVPCVQMTTRQALEVAMNIIYVAKVEENCNAERQG